MRTGLVHIYFGDGKGKTSAALGLALRALGRGLRVSVVQFLKVAPSGEVEALKRFEHARVLRADASDDRFYWQMDAEERMRYLVGQRALFEEATSLDADVLVLDEALPALKLGAFSEEMLLRFLRERNPAMEVVLTGREPTPGVLEMGDYAVRMDNIAHPFDRGQAARDGIEF